MSIPVQDPHRDHKTELQLPMHPCYYVQEDFPKDVVTEQTKMEHNMLRQHSNTLNNVIKPLLAAWGAYLIQVQHSPEILNTNS